MADRPRCGGRPGPAGRRCRLQTAQARVGRRHQQAILETHADVTGGAVGEAEAGQQLTKAAMSSRRRLSPHGAHQGALMKKSGAPKLPDFSASASGGSRARGPGHARIDRRADAQPLDAERADHRAAVSPATTRRRTPCSTRPCAIAAIAALDRGAGALAAEPLLHLRDLLGRRRRGDQHGPSPRCRSANAERARDVIAAVGGPDPGRARRPCGAAARWLAERSPPSSCRRGSPRARRVRQPVGPRSRRRRPCAGSSLGQTAACPAAGDQRGVRGGGASASRWRSLSASAIACLIRRAPLGAARIASGPRSTTG